MFDRSRPKSRPFPVEHFPLHLLGGSKDFVHESIIMTAMYPTPANPAFGSFVRTQAESLKRAGVEIEVLVLGGRLSKVDLPQGHLSIARRLLGAPLILSTPITVTSA